MRDKLLTLDEVHTALSRTEPLKTELFTVGDAIRFDADPTFHHGMAAHTPEDPVGVFATLGLGQFKRTFQLTRNSLNELCTTFGFKQTYVNDCPAELLVPHMNYWYR